MRKKAATILVVLILIAFSVPLAAQSPAHQLSIHSADGKRVAVFNVEFAFSPKQQEQGLMNRTSMPLDSGMLFVFPQEAERAFWMKSTLIPLDMLFIKKDGTIHHIHENAIPNDLTSISSRGPVIAVLELNGGACRTFKIKTGDRIVHPFFESAWEE